MSKFIIQNVSPISVVLSDISSDGDLIVRPGSIINLYEAINNADQYHIADSVSLLTNLTNGNLRWLKTFSPAEGVFDLSQVSNLRTYLKLTEANEVVGPSNVVDGNIPAFDGTTGKIIKDSGISMSSINNALQGSQIVSGKYKNIYYGDVPVLSGTATFRSSDQALSITDGVELWSRQITPQSTSSKFKIQFVVNASSSVNGSIIAIAVFRNDVNIGITHTSVNIKTLDSGTIPFLRVDVPNTTSPITYSARVASVFSNGTWYINSLYRDRDIWGIGSMAQMDYVIEEFE